MDDADSQLERSVELLRHHVRGPNASSSPDLRLQSALTQKVLQALFAAAMSGRGIRAGWEAYTALIQKVCTGRVEEVIVALKVRQSELGAPEEADFETSPRRIMADALSYLRNNKDRMRYDAYRKAGLSITSSHMESTVKLFDRRLKGAEEFWSEEGAEAILQLRADHLSENEPLEKFWEDRQASATRQRRYWRTG